MEPNSIWDIITLGNIYLYLESIRSNRIPFLGEALFPSRKKRGLTLEWLKGYDNLPVALQPSAFDAKPLLRDRRDIEQERVKMPFFRESARMGEQDRQDFMTFVEARSGQPYIDEILSRLFNDLANLVEGARIVPEMERMGLLTDGAFTIASQANSGQWVNYTYNYDPNGTWHNENFTTLTGTDIWSDYANSNPVRDILALKRSVRNRGMELTRMIIGYDTWSDLMSNEAARLDMLDPRYRERILTESDWMSYYSQKLGLTIIIYDKEYCPPGTSMSETTQNAEFFYPQRGQATFLTDRTPGYTWYGTTPEEADLQSALSDASVRIIDTGVAVCEKMESLPVNKIFWVSEIVLPSFENMNTVFNLLYTPA